MNGAALSLQILNENLLKEAKDGDVSICMSLLNRGASASYVKKEWRFGTAMPLHYILQRSLRIKDKNSKEHVELIKFAKILMQKGKNVIDTQYFCGGDILNRGSHITPIDMIVTAQNMELCRFAVEKCSVDLNKDSNYFGGMAYGSSKWYPIHTAIKKKNYQILKYLIDNGANINSIKETSSGMTIGKDNDAKQTALHIACKTNNLKLLRFLLLFYGKLDINALHEYYTDMYKHSIKETAIYIAIRNNNEYVVKLLIINGIDITINRTDTFKDNYKATPVITEITLIDYIDSIKFNKNNDENEKNKQKMKKIIGKRYFEKMLTHYPLPIQKSIQIVINVFSKEIGRIVLEYFL